MSKATLHRHAPARLKTRRTHCNMAVLVVLGAGVSAVAAPAGTVLPANTVPVLRGLVSDYKNSATFSTAPMPGGTGQAMTITQLLPKIVLNWNEFNIGSGSKVEFVQPSATAAVLNRIFGADPTIIQGQLKANGQVFLINQNGILFDRGAQIDVNTLVASSLNIDNARFQKGMTSGGAPDVQSSPAFTGGYDAADKDSTGKTIAGTKTGPIVVGANGPADAAPPQIRTSTGGAIVLIAPSIDNQSGVISSPDGQVVLAAGRSVYLGFSDVPDSSLRGMLVEVTAGTGPLDLSGLIRNAGSISADRGNVTLAGLAINQEGRISASSAMLTNGSIYLQARERNDTRRGTVNLAAGSVTETPLDTTDTTTMREGDSYAPYRPVVKIQGAQILDEGRITAPSGNVSLDAKDPANRAGARIYMAEGSSIDAAGAWSDANDSSNLLTFKVTSNELKDSPDQKTGVLRGATVTVDLRAGSGILDLTGYQQNQARSLVQKAAQGGSVTLSSSGDLIQRADSTIDVSGGGVRYSGGTEATTKLIGADGKVYDIGTAPEALQYQQIGDKFIATQPRWGYSQTYDNLLSGGSVKRPSYTQGAAGGGVRVSMGTGSNGLVLDGTMLGGVTVGSQQRAAAPLGGTLSIGAGDPNKSTQDFGIDDVTFRAGTLASLPAGFGKDSTLNAERKAELNLSTALFSAGAVSDDGNYVTHGFSTVNVNANGRITVPASVAVQGPIGGALTLNANQIEVEGRINVPAGSVTAVTVATSGSAASPVVDSSVVLGRGAAIDTSGTWTNNLLTRSASAVPTAVGSAGTTFASNGGSVTLDGPVVNLAAGSMVDVSAGGSVSISGAVSGGAAGSISITADSSRVANPMNLEGTLSGFGFTNGGSLSLSSGSAVRIGAGVDSSVGLNLSSGFFTRGGFQSYSVFAARDLVVAGGSIVQPKQSNLQVVSALATALATGADAAGASRVITLADDVRKPTSLSLGSGAALSLQTGSAIETDVGASVKLAGTSGVSIDGNVSAPGGAISVSVSAPDRPGASPVLELGPHASLSARGAFVAKPNDRQLVQGTLVAGGSVTLSAQKADLRLKAGSAIDVSGERQAVDVPAAPGAQTPYEREVRFSNAGTISIAATDEVSLDGALRGTAGNLAAGGSFVLSLSARGDFADPGTGRRIVVTSSGTPAPRSASFKDATISVDKLVGGGFDKLRLKSENEILFADDATLRFDRGVTLDSQVIQVANDADVRLYASNVKLSNSFGQRFRSDLNDPSNPTSKLDPTAASLPQATLAGQGSFSAYADTLDVFGNVTISGTQSVTLSALHDLRLSGRTVGSPSNTQGAVLTGSLVAAGDLTLAAAQIYPTTGSSFTVAVADGLTRTPVADGRIGIAQSGGTRGAVYSAGGSLTLAADNIAQGGVVEAPLGALNFQAGKSLLLAPNSLTSVSANGLTIPYGETQAGVTWTYAPTGSNGNTNALTAPPAKQITLKSPAVEVQAGATVDVSGGGDLAAVEFVPGSGGSKDALLASNTFAIIPRANLSSAPIDPDLALKSPGFGSDSSTYNGIRIGAGGAVPAGEYVLLPGYYGLLPGGYVVQLIAGSTYNNLRTGQTATLPNGLTVVPGVMSAIGTDLTASNTIGVVVRPGSDIPKLADYAVTPAAYFAALADKSRVAAPRLPGDGGQLSIAASQRLTLQGTLQAGLPTDESRSAEVDIAASKIALVDAVGRTDIGADYLQIDAASLSKLGASLLIGGVRSAAAGGPVITPSASDIVVANSATSELKAPELILAATDTISVRSGSRIESGGTRIAKAEDLSIGGSGAASGALVRVANSGLVNITRAPGAAATKGTVRIDAGATLVSTGSLTLDGTLTTTSKGDLSVAAGGALALSSGSVSLGETAGLAGADQGLVLDNAQLAGFNTLGTLSLKSYHGVDLYGHAEIGSAALKNLVIDSASLAGHASSAGAPASAQINAGRVTLINTSADTGLPVVAGAGAGKLGIDAGQLTLGAGSKLVSGYSTTQLNASGEILAAQTGSLQTTSALQLQAARIGSESGANQTWTALDTSGAGAPVYRAVTIGASGSTAALAESTALGSRLTIAGASISDAGAIVLKSGSVSLQALGPADSDKVQLLSGAVIDAGGASKDFKGSIAVADAGKVSLTSANALVSVTTGASVNVAAASAGGNAGSLTVNAAGAALDGTLTGGSATGVQGSFSMDVGALNEFSTLNAKLNDSGFTEGRDIRVRSGDLAVAASDVVKARRVVMASDAGTVDVRGRIDASGTLGGGSVALYGASVRVASGAVIDASGTSTASDATDVIAPYAHGGSVTMAAQGGNLSFDNGAVIDVRAGAKGSAGSVLMRAPRTPNSVQATLAGQVLSQRHAADAAAEVVVEGNRVYSAAETGSAVTLDMMNGYATDNSAFMAAVNAAAIAANVRGDSGAVQGNVHVRPAVEIRAAGDLAIADNWDLTGSGWLTRPPGSTKSEAGTLTVRAGGNLTLASASVGNPDNALQVTPTWSVNMASGADLAAANPLQTRSATQLAAQAATGAAGAGDLVLDSQTAEASIRTGTGQIQLAAGRDFVIKAGADAFTGAPLVGVVYTAGKAAITDPLTAPEDGRFAQGGGNVSIAAQRNVIGAGNEWMTEWFRSATDGDGGLANGAWWAYRPNFHDGVAALGGGNVSVAAGNDIVNLSAWAPTSAIKVGSGASGKLQAFGGGDLSVSAGNDIVGGQYMASRGSAAVAAGGSVGTPGQGSQVFMMGATGDDATARSTLTVTAGQSIELRTIDNPSSLYQTGTFSDIPSFNQGNKLGVFSYSTNSSAALVAKSGDINIGNRPAANLTLNPDDQQFVQIQITSAAASAALWPAKVAMTAFDGNIAYTGTEGGGTLFPTTASGVKLLAGKGIAGMNVTVSDADPALLSIDKVSENASVDYSDLLKTLPSTPNRVVNNTSADLFVNDVVALGGSIKGVTFTFPARSRIWAAADIFNPALKLQNLAAGDETQVIADKGSVSILQPAPWGISGSGVLRIQAGQDVSLGTAPLVSDGNQKNQSLIEAKGADVTVLAGVSGPVDLAKLDPTFDVLVKAGNAKDADAAKAAADALFANAKVGHGDINSYGTSIQTNAGSTINLLAPGGNITVGLTTPNTNKLIGVVTNAGGAIRGYLGGNFDINQGKVLTAQGGDILIYTSQGSIDAGRGAKTSVTTPPPRRTPIFDANQNLIGYSYTLPVAVAGSGIQTVTSKPNGPTSVAPPSGNIYLFAPSGIIDAGEAGIKSGGNIFIAALTVLNADNISSVGTAVGVPPVAVGSLASTVAASGATTAASAGKDSDVAAQTAAAAQAAAAAGAGFKPAILTVEVLGFGDKNCKEQDKDCFAK